MHDGSHSVESYETVHRAANRADTHTLWRDTGANVPTMGPSCGHRLEPAAEREKESWK